MDGRVERYLEEVVARIEEVLADELEGVYLGGSLAYDDFELHLSDIDLLVLSRGEVALDRRKRLAERLHHERLPPPALGLDLCLLDGRRLRAPDEEVAYQLSLSTGTEWGFDLSFDGRERELLIDLSICRDRGRSLSGPPPDAVIGRISEEPLRRALAQVVVWHQDYVHHAFHDPLGDNAVLNASRAWRWLAERWLGSKSAGGEWLLARGEDRFEPIVREALAIRKGDRNARVGRDAALELLRHVALLFAEP